MNRRVPVEPQEPERYEQWEGPRYRFDTTRRDFLRALGGGLLVGAAIFGVADSTLAAPSRRDRARRDGADDRVSAWLRIGPDGSVTVYTGKVEVGQGVRTSLAQIVAENLGVEMADIEMVMGDTTLTPYDAGTHGSQSTPRMGTRLCAVASTARRILIDLAAKQWNVDPATLTAGNGEVRDAEGRRTATYASLVEGADLAAVIDVDAPPQPPERWEVVGAPIGRTDALDIVTGRQVFVSDISLPGMQHGKVLRAPSMGARLRSVDASAAEAMPGITVVQDGDFVGVVAPEPHIAEAALQSVRAEWDPEPRPSAAELFEYLVAHPIDPGGWRGGRETRLGAPDKAMRRARRRLEAEYTLPYLAHAPLEPRAAVAAWVGDRLVVWSGTQHPFSVRDDLAQAFSLSPDQVRVRVPPTGSGYGGKHTSETALEAARLARAAKTPVKLVWTREEEFWWAYFRPAGVMRIRSGIDAGGSIVAWEHVNYNSGASSLDPPYVFPNKRVVFQPAASPARQGSYRALASTANCFARESHLDEIARAVGADPLELRRRHLDEPRLRAVLDAVAERVKWSEPRAAGRGRGLALGTDKGGYVCTCAEVTIGAGGDVEVTRLVTAFECGAIVNPDNLRNQVEGGVIMALGGALFEAVELDRGKVLNGRFSHYRVPRFTDVPELETILLDRRDLPSAGAGETPVIAVAPAIANAIVDAGGPRLRALPLVPTGRLPSK